MDEPTTRTREEAFDALCDALAAADAHCRVILAGESTPGVRAHALAATRQLSQAVAVAFEIMEMTTTPETVQKRDVPKATPYREVRLKGGPAAGWNTPPGMHTRRLWLAQLTEPPHSVVHIEAGALEVPQIPLGAVVVGCYEVPEGAAEAKWLPAKRWSIRSRGRASVPVES
jgi:hypothetical protein